MPPPSGGKGGGKVRVAFVYDKKKETLNIFKIATFVPSPQ